jgi:hypothetical protein
MNRMEVENPSQLLVRRGVLGALMVGLALVFIMQDREPGPTLYLVSGGLAFIFLVSAFTKWRRTGWLGILAYVSLASGMLTSGNGLLGTLTGLFLAALTALQRYEIVEPPPDEADGSLERFQPQPR